MATRVAVAGAALLLTLLLFAGTADAGSVKRVHYAKNEPSALSTFFDKGGLQLQASCLPGPNINLQADQSNGGSAMIHVNKQSFGQAEYAENDASGNLGLSNLSFLKDDDIGQIIFAGPGGKVVTIDFAVEEDDGYGEAKDCVFVGTARVLKPGSSSRINFRAADDTGTTTILNKGGLRLRGTCDSGAGGLIVTAETTTDHALLHLNTQGANVQFQGANPTEDWDTNTIIAPFSPANLGTGANDSSTGQIVYARPGGHNVTVDWAAESDGAFNEDKECAFVGTARHRKPGDPKRVNYRQVFNGPSAQAFLGGGLSLRGSCPDPEDLALRVATSKDHALIHMDAQGPGSTEYGDDDNFNKNEDPRDIFENFLVADPSDDSGQIVYSTPGGTHVSVDWASSEDGPFGGTKGCAFVGTAEVAKP